METLELPIISTEEDRLSRLHRWLTYEISGLTVGGIGFFGPYALVGGLRIWAAVLFTPYMLWRLFEARRYGWMIGFVLFVGFPALIGHLLHLGVILLPLGAFYVYTWALRHAVGKWLDDFRSMRWARTHTSGQLGDPEGLLGSRNQGQP